MMLDSLVWKSSDGARHVSKKVEAPGMRTIHKHMTEKEYKGRNEKQDGRAQFPHLTTLSYMEERVSTRQQNEENSSGFFKSECFFTYQYF